MVADGAPRGLAMKGKLCSNSFGLLATRQLEGVILPHFPPALKNTRPTDLKQSVAGDMHIFLLSSFSYDDVDQWPLIPHFFSHYQGSLGLEPEHFLLILHSDSRNIAGLEHMERWLRLE